jgi:putative PIG3 family NAD(P)H quinone oxidoreductase
MTSISRKLPESMLAIDIQRPGGPQELVASSHPLPVPGAGQLLVQVAAAGVNRPDVFQRMGSYPAPKGASPIPGLEFSGRVVAVGDGVSRFQAGDFICALVAGGGYAEYCIVHEKNALPIPDGLTLLEAAALPETFFTVWSNVFQRGHLSAGETVLIHGGTSGIGTVATMLAKSFGAHVIVTVGSSEKCHAALALGAEAAINYREQDFVTEIKRLTEGRGADMIVDLIAGEYVAKNYAAAAVDGRIVQIGVQNGIANGVNFGLMLVKRLTHTGSTLRARSIDDKASIAHELEAKVWPLLASGRIKPQIFRTLPLAEAAQAHTLMESSTHVGKIMLVTDALEDLEAMLRH